MDPKNIGYIICESSYDDSEFEIKDEMSGRVVAEGVLQEADAINRNKRCYAREDLAREICAPRQRELIKTGNMFGEAGHPMSTELRRQATIEPNNVQVLYTKFWMEGNLVKGKFMGAFNSLGDEFDRSLRFGCKPSFSLRALGSIENRNGKAYVKNLKLITYDRVIYPSHVKAYTSKVLTESADLYEYQTPDSIVQNGNEILVKEGYQVVTPVSNRSVRDYIMQESGNLQTIIQNFDTFYESINLSKDAQTVTLVDKNYDTIVIPLERHVQNEIMEFCSRL